MSERVTMPALGESVTEGTVTRWLKNVGDSIEVDEPLLEVSTDKVDTEIPSPVAGVLQEILANEDDTVPVGADLAVIGEGSGGSGGDEGSQQQDGSQQDGSQQDQGGQEQGGQQSDQSQGGQQQVSGEQQANQEQRAEQPEEQPQEAAPSSEQPQQEQPQQEQPQQEQPQQAQQDNQSQQGDQGQQAYYGGGAGEGENVKMPALGESVTEGTVTRWLKSEGDTVEMDEPLLEVSTDKVDTEIPSPVAGTITKILVQEDDTVPVGGDLAIIGGSGGGGSAPAQEQPQEQQQAEPKQEAPQQEAPQQAPQQQVPSAAASTPAEAPAPAQPQQDQHAQPQQAQPQQDQPQQDQHAQPQQAQAAAPAGQSGDQSADASSYVTPLVRKLAAENSVDLGSLKGTGVGGRIRKQDVLDAAKAAKEQAAAQPAQPAATGAPAAASAPSAPSAPSATPTSAASSAKRGTTEKMSRLRQTIAKRMVESLQVSAQLTTVVEVDVTKVARLRQKSKADFERREGLKLSFLPFFALAAVEALKEYPQVNSSVEGDQVTYHGQENLGVAVDTERGLLVPVIKNAGDLNIAGLARAIADLADRTRNNKITPDELSGGTFTLTNTGSRGALFDTPIINQPNVGILGTGAVVKRPVVVSDADGGETIAVRSMAYLALSYDHRVVDGADAARFLSAMKARLEDGNFEV
jgi:pyruvate dehydrogenase E2 component (dihydrolipoamide acetyltransferase)